LERSAFAVAKKRKAPKKTDQIQADRKREKNCLGGGNRKVWMSHIGAQRMGRFVALFDKWV